MGNFASFQRKVRMRVGFRLANLIDLIFRSRDSHLTNIQPRQRNIFYSISFFNFPIATLFRAEKEDVNKKVVKKGRAREVVKFLSFFGKTLLVVRR